MPWQGHHRRPLSELIFRMFPAPHFITRILSTAVIPGLALALGTAQGLAQRPLGIDVSHYQGAIDWTSVKTSGVSFAWAKATEGSGTGDAYFAGNMVNAKAAGVCIGAYHFAHPENNTPATEANYFWSVAGTYIKGDGVSVQPMLDYETFSAPGGIPVGATNYADWANQWCNDIVSAAAAAGVTVRPVIYTSTCEAGYLDSRDAQWLPWIANPSGQPAQTGSPWTSTSCSSSSYEIWGSGVWSVWQYSWTGTVPGIAGTSNVDLDVFNGTSNQMVATLVVVTNALPSVTLASRLDRVVDSGGSASFSALALGTPPLNYQWVLNGSVISGETNATININNAQINNAGNYAVIVTNISGSITSSAVSLTVYPPQTTVFADNFDTDSTANWTVNRSSSDTAVTFAFDYSGLGIPSAPHSTGGTTLGVQMKANLTLGVVAALSISPMNQSFSGDYRLHFDGWINVNGPFPGGGSGSTEFLTAGIGTAGNRTEWTGSGSTADGYYFSADGDGGVSATSTTTGDYSGYAGTVWKNAASGIYDAGSLDNANPYFTAMFPTGQSAPVLQQMIYPSQTGALNPGTFGLAWHDVMISRRGSTVDWVIDGIKMATITNSTFTASNIFVGFWDPFASLSANNAINFGLVDNVRVEVPAVAAQFQLISLQPDGSLQLVASGLPSATYVIETSTNLVNWTAYANLVATNGVLELNFVPPANDWQRFFRARSGP